MPGDVAQEPGMRMADWVGRAAKVRRGFSTKAGAVFEVGDRVEVTGHHRGGLSIEAPSAGAGEAKRTALRVPRWMIELLPKEGAS